MPVVEVVKKGHLIMDLIRAAGFATSASEARRLIAQGAVSVDGSKTIDHMAIVEIGDMPVILKVGKRKFCRVKGS